MSVGSATQDVGIRNWRLSDRKGGQPEHDQRPASNNLHDYDANIVIFHQKVVLMVKEFSSIAELKSIREQKSRISERENELSRPIIQKVELISEIYGWFREILSEMALEPNIESVTQRKKFLFIILFLFAPSVLAGGRLPNGIRAELSKVFPEISPCVISNNIADVPFIYQNYKDFRQDIDYLYTEIVKRLRIKGLIE